MRPENYKRVISFLNTTTNEELVYLLQCIGDRININIATDEESKPLDQINTLEICEPHSDIFLNGLNIDIYIKY
jgi:hypothetical protein